MFSFNAPRYLCRGMTAVIDAIDSQIVALAPPRQILPEDGLMQAGMNANKSTDMLSGRYGAFGVSCMFWLALIFLLAWWLLKKRDVRA